MITRIAPPISLAKRLRAYLGAVAAVLPAISVSASAPGAPRHPVEGAFYVDYRGVVPTAAAAAFPLSILHPSAKVDLPALHRAGARSLAYVSVGEIAADAPYRGEAMAKGLPLIGRNPHWDSDIIDLSDEGWRDFLLEKVVAPAMRSGFDGLFLDTPDTLLAKAPADSARGKRLRQGLVTFIRRLRTEYPSAKIVVNRGFEVLPELRGTVDGVLAESVFHGFDPATGKNAPMPESETRHLLSVLRGLKKDGFEVFVLDYADPKDEAAARDAAAQIRAEGFHALVSTPDLMGRILAPWREQRRKLVTFYTTSPTVQWPEDSFTANIVQTPAEWLGYDVEYVDVKNGFNPPFDAPVNYAGVIIPRNLALPEGADKAYVDWLVTMKAAGAKLIFFGGITEIRDGFQRRRLLNELGLHGDGEVYSATTLNIDAVDEATMNYEVPVENTPRAVPRIEPGSPEARVALRCSVKTRTGESFSTAPVFTAEWGGVALEPFITWQRPDFVEFWYLDPFRFLTAALGGRDLPATDATTSHGVRLFMSHIDGDGFANRSTVASDVFTGEVIRDRVLAKYPLPVSVSVVEAEVACIAANLDAKDRPRLEDIARDIFRMPNIEVASHAYSHPFVWIPGDRTAEIYDTLSLVLKHPYTIDLDREIAGSIRYINENLAPKDKPVSLFLWSGNCRPGPEALRKVREQGIEAMNGGDTLISALNKTVTSVAARSIPWDDELQVRSPMQNENVYTHLFTGHVRGSFIRLLQTLEMTESPRRLKPACLYYHFYSGDRPDSLRAIEAVCDWAMRNTLHPVTGSEYARIVRDATGTRIYRDGEGAALISGTGKLRTVRLPVSAGRPDIARSPGITGFHDKDEERYVHLSDAPVKILRLAENPPAHPYLKLAEQELENLVLTENAVGVTTRGWKSGELVFAGFTPGEKLTLRRNDTTATLVADTEGAVTLRVPRGTRVELIRETSAR